MEAALATILRQKTALQGAGRTDAGVHAVGQTASFVTEAAITPDRLRKGITALCRPDVAVVEAAASPEGFNARFDAVGKHYRYTILNRAAPSPLLQNRVFFVPAPLDLAPMRRAAQLLVGEHDFAGFRSSDCERTNTVRKMQEIVISRNDAVIHIDVKGTAFLKNMVRIIAGTLVDVGRGRLSVADVQSVRDAKDRKLAGQTAPAHGLTLQEVFYPKGWLRKRDR
jgi:tRNA pseudouridine38-40 synthase